MKQLLVGISSKNESLNNDNNDLNIKIISLIKLFKSKDALFTKKSSQKKFYFKIWISENKCYKYYNSL